jgi:two-component system, chemotaxis family, CheB/CheR fusion protein
VGPIYALERYQRTEEKGKLESAKGPAAAAMDNDKRDRQNREADAREIDRLRFLLKQAGIDAERILREIEVTEQRHVREVTEERARTNEIRHRLKNTLAVVQAIANATLSPDVAMEDARAAFNSRLEALSRARDILFRSNWARADLRTIIDGILAPYAERGRNRIRANGPEVSLGAKPALAFGLALNELGTNAVKYGALSNDKGYIEIAWTLASYPRGREFCLHWRERNGPPVLPPTRTGFGTQLIQRNLAAEFKGEVELEYQPDGVECTIYAPAEGLGLTESRAD